MVCKNKIKKVKNKHKATKPPKNNPKASPNTQKNTRKAAKPHIKPNKTAKNTQMFHADIMLKESRTKKTSKSQKKEYT